MGESNIQCAHLINDAGHGTIMRSVWRLLLDNKTKSKKHVCWLYGVASSGKTKFIKRLGSIFASDEVDWRG